MNERRFIQAPPPSEAPVDELGEAYGLPKGIRFEVKEYQFRCSCCQEMQQPDSPMAWVPTSVRQGDPEWSVTEAARRNAFNGHFSGWCLKCAQTLKDKPPAVIATKARSLWKWLTRTT